MELTIKVENKKVYDSLIQLFQSIGIPVVENSTPFSNYENNSNSPTYGRLKGKIKTSKDFNEPISDFEDYMQ